MKLELSKNDLLTVQLVSIVCALIAPAVTLGYFGKNQLMKEDKGDLRSSIDDMFYQRDEAREELAEANNNNRNSQKLKDELEKIELLNKNATGQVSMFVLQVYDTLLLSYVTSILTIIFIVACFILIFTKIKINKNGQFMLKVVILGLAIASIYSASMANEIFDLKFLKLDPITWPTESNNVPEQQKEKIITWRSGAEDLIKTIKSKIILKMANSQDIQVLKTQLKKLENMLDMIDIVVITSYVNFSVLILLLLATIY